MGRMWHREQEQRKLQIARRVCSYCKEPKHNRRGCKTLKEDKQLIAERQQQYRQEFYHATSSVGFGPGALVKYPTGRHGDEGGVWSKGVIAMVTGIRWNRIDFLLKDVDITREWRSSSREIVDTRAVSTFGYTEEDRDSYYGVPAHNQRGTLKVHQLAEILSPAFQPGLDLGEDSYLAAQLIGPVETVMAYPSELMVFTSEIEDKFNLAPGRTASDYEKERLHIGREAWSIVRKEEHDNYQNS
tara:strand:+ start:441 stop:1169 length:729 start_codon:yes stop_codon:yes gene_type:complete